MRTLGEIMEYVRAYGLAGLARTFIKRYVYRFDTEIITVRSLAEPIPEIPPPLDVTIREATLDDVEELFEAASAHNWKRTRKQLSDWIAGGNPFLVAVAGGKIVGYVCASLDFSSRDPLLLKGLRSALDLADGDAWGADAFVLPSHRGRRIYPALGTEILKHAKDAGVRRIIGTITARNDLSRSAHRRIGVKEIGEITFRRLLFWTSATYERMI